MAGWLAGWLGWWLGGWVAGFYKYITNSAQTEVRAGAELGNILFDAFCTNSSVNLDMIYKAHT